MFKARHNTTKLTGVMPTRNSQTLSGIPKVLFPSTACCKGKHGTDQCTFTLNTFYTVVIFTMSSFLSKYTVLQSSLNIFLHLLFTMTTACRICIHEVYFFRMSRTIRTHSVQWNAPELCARTTRTVFCVHHVKVVQSGQNMADRVKRDLNIEHDRYLTLIVAQVHLVQ
jgi:hypothetical protein